MPSSISPASQTTQASSLIPAWAARSTTRPSCRWSTSPGKAGVTRFIYASSSSVYGIKEEPNVTEELALEPLTDYSKFKAMCEDELEKRRSPGFTTVTLRPATVCGYSPRLRLDLSVNILTNHAINKGRITVFGGDQLRPNFHVRDCAELYVQLLAHPAKLIDGKVFNAGYQNLSIRAIAELVRSIIGSNVEIRQHTERRQPLLSHLVGKNKTRTWLHAPLFDRGRGARSQGRLRRMQGHRPADQSALLQHQADAGSPPQVKNAPPTPRKWPGSRPWREASGFELISMSHRAQSAHLAGALSCVDLLVALYWTRLRIDPLQPADPARDRLIFSKGHAISALYTTLAKKGFFPEEELLQFNVEGSRLPEQPSPGCVPVSSGPPARSVTDSASGSAWRWPHAFAKFPTTFTSS